MIDWKSSALWLGLVLLAAIAVYGVVRYERWANHYSAIVWNPTLRVWLNGARMALCVFCIMGIAMCFLPRATVIALFESRTFIFTYAGIVFASVCIALLPPAFMFAYYMFEKERLGLADIRPFFGCMKEMAVSFGFVFIASSGLNLAHIVHMKLHVSP